jgi:hypothetical protein
VDNSEGEIVESNTLVNLVGFHELKYSEKRERLAEALKTFAPIIQRIDLSLWL